MNTRVWNPESKSIIVRDLEEMTQGEILNYLLKNLNDLLIYLTTEIPGSIENKYLLKNDIIETETSYNRDVYNTFDFINNLIDSIRAIITLNQIRRYDYLITDKENLIEIIRQLRRLITTSESDFVKNSIIRMDFFLAMINSLEVRLDMADPMGKKYYQKYLKYKSKYLELRNKLRNY
jgi:hypothetical protein